MPKHLKKLVVVLLFVLLALGEVLFATSSFAATIIISEGVTDNCYLSAAAGPIYLFTAGTYTVRVSMVVEPGVRLHFQEANFILVIGQSPASPATLQVNGTSGSPCFISNTAVGTNWGGIRLQGGSSATINYCEIGGTSDSPVSPNIGINLIENSSLTITNSLIRARTGQGIRCASPTNRLWVDSCDIAGPTGILLAEVSSANILFSRIAGSSTAVVNNANNNPAIPTANVSFCEVNRGTLTFTNTNGGKLNAEFNYYPSGISNTGSNIDTSPSLNNTPYPFFNAGTTAASPLRIQTGDINYSHILPGAISPSNKYYRVEGGGLTLDNTAVFSLGRDFYTGAVLGGTRLAFPAGASFVIQPNSTLEVLGSGTAHRSQLTSAQNFSGSPAVNQWDYLSIAPGGVVSMNFAEISCGRGLQTLSSSVTCNETLFTTASVGVSCNNAFPKIVSSNFINISQYNIVANNGSTLTVNAEYNFFGRNPPDYTKFSGTGIIDYEPWYADAAHTVPTVAAPVSPSLSTPLNHANLDAAPTAYFFTGNDIGMYGDSPLVHEIRLASNNLMAAPLIFDVTMPNTTNGLVAYPTNNALNTGILYYWQVRSLDPYGANMWSEWSPTWDFTIQGPSINLQILANTSQAGAGDIVNYTVSFNNTGGPATNTLLTNVLPNDIFFNNSGAGIQIPTNANAVTYSVYNAATGGTLLGWQAFTPPSGVFQAVTWTGDPLTNAEALQVRRIEVNVQTITKNAQGFVYYRTNVK